MCMFGSISVASKHVLNYLVVGGSMGGGWGWGYGFVGGWGAGWGGDSH